jgi:hypothetical protein
LIFCPPKWHLKQLLDAFGLKRPPNSVVASYSSLLPSASPVSSLVPACTAPGRAGMCIARKLSRNRPNNASSRREGIYRCSAVQCEDISERQSVAVRADLPIYYNHQFPATLPGAGNFSGSSPIIYIIFESFDRLGLKYIFSYLK